MNLINSKTAKLIHIGYPYIGHTLILFLRGTWCIFCVEQLKALSVAMDSLTQIGMRIVCVSPESHNKLSAYSAKSGLSVPLFSDSSRAAAKAFGVHYWVRYDGLNLAHPSLFIVSPNGEILVSYVSKTMADLPVGSLLDRFLTFLDPEFTGTQDASR